jgi:pimeloyl-ACP methyl ester carboxylesterase
MPALTLPTLVLLPGLDGSRVLFEPFLERIGASASVVVEYPASGPNSYEALLPFARERLPADRPFVLLASSFGGPLALRLAAEEPSGLRGVILCASFAASPHPWARTLRWAVFPPLSRAYPTLARLKARLLGYGGPAMTDLIHRAARSATPEALAERVRAALAVDASDALRATRVPILCIAATWDEVVPGHCVKRISRLAPHVRTERVAGPHMVLAVSPGEIARFVLPFLAAS